ncbi:cytochrome P450 4g15 [Anabrus simplex]|uniref:cytochrome P450 4g15 n=1 Tax=Anabrus simplex TaxID=316456 RepID=UPI0035A39D7E
MSEVFIILLLLPLLWYALYRYKRKHFIALANKLPGPRGLPLIGNAFDFIGKNEEVFRRLYSLTYYHENVLRLWIGPRALVIVSDPRDIELILGSTEMLNKSVEYEFFRPWLGQGLLISSGEKWRSHRKLIAPTFHQSVLKSFVDVFNINSQIISQRMHNEQHGKTFDVHHYMSECTVNILLETAMGVTKATQDGGGFEYAMAVIKMCDILHLRHTKLWLRPNLLFKMSGLSKVQGKLLEVIHGLTRKVVKKRKEDVKDGITSHIEEIAAPIPKKGLDGPVTAPRDDLDEQDENDVGEKKRLAFLDLMIESARNGLVLTDEEIKEEVDTIMFEGHDTTAAASSFFLSLMGIYQDIQDQVVEELDGIFGESKRPATFQDTMEMRLLERCILESLRLFPPVPIIARQVPKDFKLVSGDYVVPAGCTVVVATFKLHRRSDIYKDPETFNPDRFLPENSQGRHFYSFVPFSAGPRSCVGRKYAMLKLKIILSTILRNFRVYSDVKEESFRLTGDIILKRAEGFNIRIEPRHTVAAL